MSQNKIIIFVSGNNNKIKEVKEIIGDSIKIECKDIDLPEIQSTIVSDVAVDKLNRAIEILGEPCVIEDSGLHFQKIGEFPGALIKFYYKSLKNEGICQQVGGSKAKAVTVIGYFDGEKSHFFKGEAYGSVPYRPQGDEKFGWDPIFIPDGKDKSYAELTVEEKNKISQRNKALLKFKEHLESNNE
jgi:non-canonical purine NTP pyrophosphatase (RdgB/HAM1 family)